ncbi:hypothetical protein [Flammeovirga sp. SubArs3]|uniref:hypothetical protein n=1 Tax=Flammeovirga sp. SubArs3 TaxID=2995316 RepID=UPI00248C1E07|nr:hypothetical protein [Flammeovirga sp. SubArs3]
MKNKFIATFSLIFVFILFTYINSQAQSHPKGYLSITTSGSRVMQRNAHSGIISLDYNHYLSDSWMIGTSIVGDWEKENGINQPFKSSVAIYGTYLFGKNKHWGIGGGYAKDIVSGSDFKLGNDYIDGFIMYFIPIGNIGYICPRVGYVHDIQDQEQSISAGVSFSIPIGK